MPSQWKIVETIWCATTPPTAQPSFGPVKYTDFRTGGLATGPPGMVGVETGVHFEPSQYTMMGPIAAPELGVLYPPAAQPLVGLSMKTEFKFADTAGVKVRPPTVTTFHVPTPPVTV